MRRPVGAPQASDHPVADRERAIATRSILRGRRHPRRSVARADRPRPRRRRAFTAFATSITASAAEPATSLARFFYQAAATRPSRRPATSVAAANSPPTTRFGVPPPPGPVRISATSPDSPSARPGRVLERNDFVSGCTKDYVPQQYSLSITSTTGSTTTASGVTTVIFDPSAPPPPNGVGTPTQLVWLQTPTTAQWDRQ